MEDSSLDDFFAKKDKSKKSKSKTSKTKIIASELLPSPPSNEGNASGTDDLITNQVHDLKVIEEPIDQKERKKSKKKKDRDGAEDQRKKEDDEWVAPEKEVDYSGLRIASKTIAKSSADDGNEGSADSEAEYDEHGQLVPRSSEQGSVWRSVTPIPQPSLDEEDNDKSEVNETPQTTSADTVVPELPNVTGGKYVPPSRRGQQATSASATGRNPDGTLQPMVIGKRVIRKKVAPNITSQEDFPTLGATPPPSDPDTTSFEKVRGGGSGQHVSAHSGGATRVETKNMFSALR